MGHYGRSKDPNDEFRDGAALRLKLSERQQEIAAGLSFILLFTLGFGLGEGALRAIQFAKFGTATTVEESAKFFIDAESGLRLPVPGSVHGQVAYNKLGYRGPEIPEVPDKNTIRIAFMGSSTTLDAYAPNNGTWSHVAIEHLREKYPACHFDYINAGVPGYSTARTTDYFRHRVSKNRPHLVVLMPRDINLHADDLAKERLGFDGMHYRPSWFAEVSVLWAKLEKNTVIIARQRAAFRKGDDRLTDIDDIARDFEPRLRYFIDAVRETDAQPLMLAITGQLRPEQSKQDQVRAANTSLFYMPYMTIDSLLGAEAAFNEAIYAVGADMGVPVIGDHLSVPGDEKHFADSLHFTARGARFAGTRIAAALVKSQQMKDLVKSCA